MDAWWGSQDSFQKVFYLIAFISTVILILQSILSILGLDQDIDTDMDAGLLDDFGDADFQFFSIRGIIAFFTMFGWTGALLSNSNLNRVIVLALSMVAGSIGMIIVAALFYSVSKLQYSGNINYQNAIGQTGEVYIPIPEKRQGKGKVTVTIQGRYIEADAVTDEKKVLTTGTVIKITDVINESVFVVNKYN